MGETVKHYAQHVDWFMLAIIYALFAWGLWGNPRWWAGALAAPVIPVMIAIKGHILYCKIQDDVAKETWLEEE